MSSSFTLPEQNCHFLSSIHKQWVQDSPQVTEVGGPRAVQQHHLEVPIPDFSKTPKSKTKRLCSVTRKQGRGEGVKKGRIQGCRMSEMWAEKGGHRKQAELPVGICECSLSYSSPSHRGALRTRPANLGTRGDDCSGLLGQCPISSL